MAQKKNVLIRFVSTEKTGYFYVSKKNAKRASISLRKYDPIARKHVIFKEKKI